MAIPYRESCDASTNALETAAYRLHIAAERARIFDGPEMADLYDKWSIEAIATAAAYKNVNATLKDILRNTPMNASVKDQLERLVK